MNLPLRPKEVTQLRALLDSRADPGLFSVDELQVLHYVADGVGPPRHSTPAIKTMEARGYVPFDVDFARQVLRKLPQSDPYHYGS